MGNKYIGLVILLLILSSCGETPDTTNTQSNILSNPDTLTTEYTYARFQPDKTAPPVLDGYDIYEAHKLDSHVLFSGYHNGDLETSPTPTNWGDRLVMTKGNTILFESVPVGDPYRHEPFFFRNSVNDKVIIICQLGNEYNYGGEAFLYEKGTLTFMGNIEFETPFDTEEINCLIDIVDISERDNSIYFSFNSDSLVYMHDFAFEHMKNDSVHYKFSKDTWELIGL